MIIIKTQNLKNVNCSSNSIYECPHCNYELIFKEYITYACKNCNKQVFNVEKLLNDNTNINQVNYYKDEKI